MKLGIKLESEWEPLFIRGKVCSYVNDHTIYKNSLGKYILLGTAAKGEYSPLKENFFVRAESKSLNSKMSNEQKVFRNNPHIGPKIAPHVFFDEKTSIYHLFFAPGIIFHYISKDGESWERADDAVSSWWVWLRDPHVIESDGQYLMYLTDMGNKITVFRSNDLFRWKKDKTALRLGDDIPKSFNSSCESPCIFKWERWFILTTTITTSPTSRRENYTRTVAFAAKDPTNFGVFTKNTKGTSNDIGYLDIHAPEVIQDGKRIYITSCGWKDFPKPTGIKDEGVFIRNISLYEY